MTFTYDPLSIRDRALNQMRFELGDVFIDEPEKTAYLPDEEILAALTDTTFKRAKLKLIESLLRRFGYEVDTKVADMDLKLSQRVKFWQSEFKRTKAEVDAEEMLTGGAFKVSSHERPPAFWVGMHDGRFPTCI